MPCSYALMASTAPVGVLAAGGWAHADQQCHRAKCFGEWPAAWPTTTDGWKMWAPNQIDLGMSMDVLGLFFESFQNPNQNQTRVQEVVASFCQHMGCLQKAPAHQRGFCLVSPPFVVIQVAHGNPILWRQILDNLVIWCQRVLALSSNGSWFMVLPQAML